MMGQPEVRVPEGYSPERDGGTAFHFADETCYPCFPLDSEWNGFDNVAVSIPTHDLIVKDWGDIDGFDPQTREDLLMIDPDASGRICLGWDYATEIVGDIGMEEVGVP